MRLDLSKMLPLCIGLVVIWIAGISLGYVESLGLGPLSAALFAIGVLSFLGSLRAGADIRSALTIGFIILYFALFAALATSQRNQAQFVTEIGLKLWDNFTYLVGVIVLFYFGTTAAIEISKHAKNVAGDAKPPKQQAAPSADES